MLLSRASQYRKANRKTVQVDGFDWTIRRLPPEVLSEVMDLTGVEVSTTAITEAEKMGEKLKPKVFEIVKVVLPACVLDPKIVVVQENDDELALEDVATTTAFALLDEIYAFSDLSKEAFEKRRKFRTITPGSDGSSPNEAATETE